MNISTIKSNPWPYAIIAYFILFVAAIAVWIAYACHQKVDLVGKDYYEEEIRYQKQIDRLSRTGPIRDQVRVAYDPGLQAITIKLPSAHVPGATGEIRLYRPSDARLDRKVQLSVDATGAQRIDTAQLPAGLWKVAMAWTGADQDYFFEQPLVLGSRQF